jgi:hypothetical protein
MPLDPGELHLAVCRRIGATVRAAEERWNCPSPCDGRNARDVLEHVIGFHDVLLLRPLGLKPQRRREIRTVDGRSPSTICGRQHHTTSFKNLRNL